jgi:inner membrane protein involved in colicin E2 resistance
MIRTFGYVMVVRAVFILALAATIGFLWTYCASSIGSFLIPGMGFAHNLVVCIVAVAAFGIYLTRIFPLVVIGLVLTLDAAETKITSLFQEAFF